MEVATEPDKGCDATMDAGEGEDEVELEEDDDEEVGVGELTDDVGGCCFFLRASL